jgi:hypothetical protein
MNKKKEERIIRARARAERPLIEYCRPVFIDGDIVDKPLFIGPNRKILTYSQLTPEQKLAKLNIDVACNTFLKRAAKSTIICSKQIQKLSSKIAEMNKSTEDKIKNECPDCKGTGLVEDGTKCPSIYELPKLHKEVIVNAYKLTKSRRSYI